MPGKVQCAHGKSTDPQKPHPTVAVLEDFGLLPVRRDTQGVAPRVAQDEQAAGGNQRGQPGVVQQALGAGGGAAALVFFAVGRVGEDEIELLTRGGHPRDGGEGILDPEVEQ